MFNAIAAILFVSQIIFFVFVSETQLIVYTAFTYIFLIILIIIIVTLTCLYCVKKRRDTGRNNSKKADDTKIKFPSSQDYPNGVDDDVFTIDPRQMNGHSIPGKGSSFRPPPESTLR